MSNKKTIKEKLTADLEKLLGWYAKTTADFKKTFKLEKGIEATVYFTWTGDEWRFGDTTTNCRSFLGSLIKHGSDEIPKIIKYLDEKNRKVNVVIENRLRKIEDKYTNYIDIDWLEDFVTGYTKDDIEDLIEGITPEEDEIIEFTINNKKKKHKRKIEGPLESELPIIAEEFGLNSGDIVRVNGQKYEIKVDFPPVYSIIRD